MAQRRMFSKDITTSDLFVDMPASSQLLYFHLGMEADDEGFIGNAKMLSRAYGTNNDDLKLLIAKGFLIYFQSGVTVVKDWNVNNKIRSDRLKPTIYTDERMALNVDNTGAYVFVNQLTTNWRPDDNQMSAQDRIGKDRLVKDSIDKDSNIHDAADDQPDDYQIASRFYQSNFGPINGYNQQDLSHWVDDLGIEVTIEALKRASENQKPYSYAKGIMKQWLSKNVTCLDDVKALDTEFELNKQAKKKYKPQSKPVPKKQFKWIGNDYVEKPKDAEDDECIQKELDDAMEKLRELRKGDE